MRHKIRRTFTSVLPVAKNRVGECNNCGECCMLPFKCSFLGFKYVEGGEKPQAYCRIYPIRPLNCRKYPRSEKEQICQSCTFEFVEMERRGGFLRGLGGTEEWSRK